MKKDEYGLVIIEVTDVRDDIWKQFNENTDAIRYQLKRIDDELEEIKKCLKKQSHTS